MVAEVRVKARARAKADVAWKKTQLPARRRLSIVSATELLAGYLPVADLRAQIGVSERAFQAALDAANERSRLDTRALAQGCIRAYQGHSADCCHDLAHMCPRLSPAELRDMDRSSKARDRPPRPPGGAGPAPEQWERAQRGYTALMAQQRHGEGLVFEPGMDPRRPVVGSLARSVSAPSRPVGRSAGREVASGSTLPNRPPPAGREVARSAGSESSSELPDTRARPKVPPKASQGLRHTCHLARPR